jgi:hypothetical protein
VQRHINDIAALVQVLKKLLFIYYCVTVLLGVKHW